MTQSLREALVREADAASAFGDIDQAILDVAASRRKRMLVIGIAASVAVVVSLFVATSSSFDRRALPATPEPTPSAIDLRGTVSDGDLADAPLAEGAQVAQVQTAATVWSGGQLRTVSRSFRIWGHLLSPDGRLVATIITNDVLLVTDVTTGERVLRWKIDTSDGYRGQSPRLVWSADSQRLFQVVIETGDKGLFGQGPSPGELVVWARGSDGQFAMAADPVPLPGGLIGVSPNGDAALANSEADGSGNLAQLDVASGRWVTSDAAAAPSVNAEPPPVSYEMSRGQGCWSPDGRYVCWLGDDPSASPSVAWLDTVAGTWTQRDVSADAVEFTGWRGRDPVVLLTRGELIQVTVLAPEGEEALITYLSQPSGREGPRTSVAKTW